MLRKPAADQDLAVRLQGKRGDLIVRVRIERIRKAGRGVEPRNIISRLAPDGREQAARQYFAVRLQHELVDLRLVGPLAFGSNESARPVAGSSRAMQFRICPPIVVKLPPTRILPSA